MVLPANCVQSAAGTAVFFAQRRSKVSPRSTRLAGSSSTVAKSKAGIRCMCVSPAAASAARCFMPSEAGSVKARYLPRSPAGTVKSVALKSRM